MRTDILAVAVGAGVGTAQTFLLYEFYNPTIIPGIGGFGRLSSMLGWTLGTATLMIGLVGAIGKGPLSRYDTMNMGLVSYGLPSLIGGILTGLYP